MEPDTSPATEPKKYFAFISYSHADESWGSWLHRSLENFKVPKSLVGNPTERGEPVPARVFPIFRDREELPTSADLGGTIQRALDQSRYLIVLCSVASAKSRWVGEEILHFKRTGRENRILALIIDGEPNASGSSKPGITPEMECFPEALRHPLGPDGELDRSRFAEPIAADARPGKDGKADALLKLLAGVLGVNYDDLKRRDEIRRRQRQRIVTTVSVALVLLFAILAGLAFWQWGEAEARGREVRQAMARADVEHALTLRGGNPSRAAQLALRALGLDPNTPKAPEVLWNALASRSWLPPKNFPWALPEKVESFEKLFYSPDGNTAVALDEAGQVYYLSSSQRVEALPLENPATALATLPDMQVLIGDSAGQLSLWLAGSVVPEWTLSLSATNGSVTTIHPLSGDQGQVLAATSDGHLHLVDSTTSHLLRSWTVPEAIHRILPSYNPGLVALLAEKTGCLLLDIRFDTAPAVLWPSAGSDLGLHFDRTVVDAAFSTDISQPLSILLAGADRVLYVFQLTPDEEGTSSRWQAAGEIVPDVPPLKVATLPSGQFLVGCQDGSLLTLANGASQPFESPPAWGDALRDMLVLPNGVVARLYRSNRVDLAGNPPSSPPVESFSLIEMTSDLTPGPGRESFTVNTTSTPVLFPMTPAVLNDSAYRFPGEGHMPPIPLGFSPTLPLCYLSSDQGIMEKNLQKGTSVLRIPLDRPPLLLSVSPKGLLLVRTSDHLQLHESDGSLLYREPLASTEDTRVTWAGSIAWSPTHLALYDDSAEGASLRILDLQTGSISQADTTPPPGPLHFLDEGKKLALFSMDGLLHLFGVPGLDSLETIPLSNEEARPARDPRHLTENPLTGTLYAATFGGSLYAIPAEPHQATAAEKAGSSGASQSSERPHLPAPLTDNGPMAHLQISRSGTELLAVSDFGIVRVFDITSSRPRLLREFRTSPPTGGPSLLWAGSGPSDLLSTVDRHQGAQVWDWQGGLVADRGPQAPQAPQAPPLSFAPGTPPPDPSSLSLILRGGGNTNYTWVAHVRDGQALLSILRVASAEETAALIRQAQEMTGAPSAD